MKHINLRPGEYYVTNEQVVISTLLGSCVSACIYDPIKGIVGMNHFLLSSRRYARNIPLCLTDAGKYGVNAMELVINGMMKLGADRRNLRAKAFGGGSLFESPDRSDSFFCSGEVNCRFILEFLKNDGIQLVASDLGGNQGRTIRFLSDDYSVYVKKIRKSGSHKICEKEKKFWSKSLEKNDRAVMETDLWS